MKFFLGITAIAVATIPLIMTPTILKSAMNGLGSIGTKLSGIATKANSKVGTAVNTQSRFGEAKAGIKNNFALNRANRRVHSKLQRGIDNSSLGRSLGLDKGTARAIKAIDAEEGTEVEAAMALIQHETTSANRVDKSADMLKEAIIAGDVTKARAAQRILLNSGNVGLSTLQKIYAGTHESKDEKNRPVPGSLDLSRQAGAALNKSEATGYLRSELNSAGLKGKNNALARFGYEKLPTVNPDTFSGLVSNPDTYSSLNSVELAGQSEPNLYDNQGTISASAAQAVLENSAAAALLDDQKRAIFTARAQNTVYVKGAQAGPSAAQRAQQTAQQAAQGTAGTVPLAVDSQGTITIDRSAPNPGAGAPPTQPPAQPPTA